MLSPAQSVLAALVSTTLVVTLALGWGGWLLLDRQRVLDEQRAADQVAALRSASTESTARTPLFHPIAVDRGRMRGMGAMRAAVAVLAAAAVVVAATSGASTDAPVQSRAMVPMPADVRAELAPGGRLRAALNYSNTLLVKTRSPEHTGVAPDLARELARRAGATVAFVGYDNAGLVADAAAQDAWDVAFIGAEPARAGEIAFTRAYVEIESTYLVPAGSPLRSIADVDRPGVRIATTARAAYTLYLQRTLKHATLVEAETIPGAYDRFVAERLDVLAGLKPRLLDDAARLPGARLLEGRFTAVQQAMGVPKRRAAAAAYLVAFVDEVTTSGFLSGLIATHEARGLSVVSRPSP